jgi:hypothetical protein
VPRNAGRLLLPVEKEKSRNRSVPVVSESEAKGPSQGETKSSVQEYFQANRHQNEGEAWAFLVHCRLNRVLQQQSTA